MTYFVLETTHPIPFGYESKLAKQLEPKVWILKVNESTIGEGLGVWGFELINPIALVCYDHGVSNNQQRCQVWGIGIQPSFGKPFKACISLHYIWFPS